MSGLKFTTNCNAFVNGAGPDAIVDFCQESERLGYDFFRIPDHVVGYVAEKHPEVESNPYQWSSTFPEVFVLMAYLSAITTRIHFVTGVLNLPQRQTALVAKQAAEVDRLSKGRLVLGCGIGYNMVEFEAMEAVFKERAPRIEEQIPLLRKLWTEPVVNFDGRWHHMHDVNVAPLPPQRPIPIWLGAGRTQNPVPPEVVLRRVGRMADGFMPLFEINSQTGRLEDDAIAALAVVRAAAIEHGRDPDSMALELGLFPDGKSDDQVKDEIDYLKSIGCTHVHCRIVATQPERHYENIRRFAVIRDEYVRAA